MKTLHVTTRQEWARWLSRNHKRADEIWLVYYRKKSGQPRISYDDAVTEALRFGWIDSILRTIDDQSYAQRFSPRKRSSKLSQMNRERLRKLVAEKRMTKAGLDAVAHLFDPAEDLAEESVVPPAILAELKRNPAAWKNFQGFPAEYKRIRVAYIEGRKRHGEEAYRKALANFVDKTAKGKRIGFVKEWA